MNNFNFNRFGQTFRWVLATNFRNFLAWTIGAAVGFFLIEMILIAFSVSADGGNYVPYLYSNISQICQIALFIFVLVALSTGFADYVKKPQREAFLMLPSTNMEKFLAVVFYVTVVWTLAGFLAFAVGDTLRMAVRALLYGNEWYSLVPRLLDMFGNVTPTFHYEGSLVTPTTSYMVVYLMIWYIGFIFWIHSTYILGGTLMRKYSFVVSSLVIILCTLFLAWLIHKFDLQVFYIDTIVNGHSVLNTESVNDDIIDIVNNNKDVQILHKVGVMGYFLTVALPLLSIFNYWASYSIFKGFQLITNKWTNYDFFK